MSNAACCKPPSAAAAMVYIIRAATQFSARDVITIAAAAGNAGAALVAFRDYNEDAAQKNALLACRFRFARRTIIFPTRPYYFRQNIHITR